MKKAAVVVAFVLLMLFAVVPVVAEPSRGQKVPIVLKLKPVPGSAFPGEVRTTNGNVTQRRDAGLNYTAELSIDGASPIIGKVVAERGGMAIVSKTGMMLMHETIVLFFPTEGGGFEGNAPCHYTDFVSLTSYSLDIHAVFHGTGAFEGQTINAWRSGGANSAGFIGYLLKP